MPKSLYLIEYVFAIKPHILYNNCVAFIYYKGGVIVAKRGRPKIENPKEIKYSIRMDAATEAELKAYCVEAGITKGEAIRQAIEMLLKNNKKRGK